MAASVEIGHNSGELVKIIRSSDIESEQGNLVLQISNEEFTKGTMGRMGFTLKNTGDQEIEITTAQYSGKSPRISNLFEEYQKG